MSKSFQGFRHGGRWSLEFAFKRLAFDYRTTTRELHPPRLEETVRERERVSVYCQGKTRSSPRWSHSGVSEGVSMSKRRVRKNFWRLNNTATAALLPLVYSQLIADLCPFGTIGSGRKWADNGYGFIQKTKDLSISDQNSTVHCLTRFVEVFFLCVYWGSTAFN